MPDKQPKPSTSKPSPATKSRDKSKDKKRDGRSKEKKKEGNRPKDRTRSKDKKPSAAPHPEKVKPVKKPNAAKKTQPEKPKEHKKAKPAKEKRTPESTTPTSSEPEKRKEKRKTKPVKERRTPESTTPTSSEPEKPKEAKKPKAQVQVQPPVSSEPDIFKEAPPLKLRPLAFVEQQRPRPMKVLDVVTSSNPEGDSERWEPRKLMRSKSEEDLEPIFKPPSSPKQRAGQESEIEPTTNYGEVQDVSGYDGLDPNKSIRANLGGLPDIPSLVPHSLAQPNFYGHHLAPDVPGYDGLDPSKSIRGNLGAVPPQDLTPLLVPEPQSASVADRTASPASFESSSLGRTATIATSSEQVAPARVDLHVCDLSQVQALIDVLLQEQLSANDRDSRRAKSIDWLHRKAMSGQMADPKKAAQRMRMALFQVKLDSGLGRQMLAELRKFRILSEEVCAELSQKLDQNTTVGQLLVALAPHVKLFQQTPGVFECV